MTKDELREKANDLPLAPGVYLMMDSGGQVIYVGKAKKLKNRVSQYFQDTASHNSKTKMMVSQVDRFDTILVRSEFEALVLENSLIKRYMPRYNILLKDDKGYPFVRLEKGADYPRFSLVSRAEEHGLIRTERTEIITKDGLKRNGCLRYIMKPVETFPTTSARWRRRGKPWNGSGHRQEPKSWALRSLRQQGSGVRKVPPCTPL